MKRFNRNTGLIFASWALLLVFGCHKKRPPIPPEQEPPTILSQIPTEPTEPADTEQPTPAVPTEEANEKPAEKPEHTPPKRAKHPAPPKKAAEPEKPAPTEEAKNAPPAKVTVQEGGTNQATAQAPSSAPGDNGSSVQGTTQQLLESAEKNLNNIKRQLSADEQSLVSQVKDYIDQSRKATMDGDNVRAHILALKARLLSDELVKTQ